VRLFQLHSSSALLSPFLFSGAVSSLLAAFGLADNKLIPGFQ
jgi:hypothetical protein